MNFCIKKLNGGFLSAWATIGLLVFLCAAWFLPSNKLYHQLIIVFLWLPALVGLFVAHSRPALTTPEMLGYLLFSLWTYLVLALVGGDSVASEAKLPAYVALSLLGVTLAARQGPYRLESLLFWGAVLGGILAGISWVKFYLWEHHAFSDRLVAIGLWDKIIMAAHAVSALAILCVFLLPRRLAWWGYCLLVPATIGFLLFLGSSQTRGVWLALFAALMANVVARPNRLKVVLTALVLGGIGLICLVQPEIILQRGISYRPALWTGGLRLIGENWLLGVGFHDFFIHVPGLEVAYKHPHNLFLDTGVRFGIFGLLIFLALWALIGWRAWINRCLPLGNALLVLWVFSSVALMTDGIGLWLKPNADWFITWLPLALSMVLAERGRRAQGSLVYSDAVKPLQPY